MSSNAQTPSRQVLEETPNRALTFLRAVGLSVPIRGLLTKAGYTEDEHALGWKLLHKVSGYAAAMPKVAEDTRGRDAITELDAWDEPGLRRIRAALTRQHPEQAGFVFAGGLAPAQGAAAVLSVAKLLERLDALEKGPERKSTRKQDHAALATLAARGITPEERKRLRALVEAAQSPAPEVDDAPAGAEDARTDDLIALRAWFDDWAETARAVITRRDYLIRLGLARRLKKATKKKDGGQEEGGAPPV
jgi:hypothetical protein